MGNSQCTRFARRSPAAGQLLLPAVLLALAACGTLRAEVVTITIDGDDTEFSYDRRYLTLQGQVVIVGQSEEDPTRKVRIEADFVEGDLKRGRFEALGNVLIVTADASFRGESAYYDASTSEFKLQRAGVMVALREVQGQKVCGYAFGEQVGKTGDIVYIVRGRFTTCNQASPHYALECDRITYHPASRKMTVRGGAFRLYGLRIPLIPRFTLRHGAEREATPGLLPLPSYSGRDGLYMRWAFPLAGDESPTQADLHLRLTTRRGPRAQLLAETPLGGFTGRARATWKEDRSNDLDELVTVHRLPELSLEREWQPGGLGGTGLLGRATLGRYCELGTGGDPDLWDSRAMAEVRLGHNQDQRSQGVGKWWWLGARQAWYEGGDDYTDLEMGLGAGGSIAPGLTGSLTLRHHEVAGHTPFEFDDVDLETELLGRSDAALGDGWGLGLLGSFDLQHSTLRDYQVELRKSVHCLTWVAGYHDLTDGVSLSVQVNGLWGNTQPYPQPPIERGPPWIWGEQQQAPEPGVGGDTALTE